MTAEHREEVSSAHSEERLRFITSPLLKDHEHESHSPPGEGVKHISNVREPDIPFANRDFDLHESPAFHRHAEAQSIELFYDLFFVANLTNFTTNHNINNVDSKCNTKPDEVRNSIIKADAPQPSHLTSVSSALFGLHGTKFLCSMFASQSTAF